VVKTLGKFRGYIEAKDLTTSGQCRLPQAERDDDEWRSGRRRLRPWPDTLEEAEDPDDAEPSADHLRDLWQQQEALLERQHEQLEAQAARIRELEAAAAWTADPSDGAEEGDAEVMAEIARLTRIAEDLQRRVRGPS
jgi:hypothetical protein